MPDQLRVAVIGHVEIVQFAEVDHIPAPGEGIDSEVLFTVAAGGGAATAVQLAELGATPTLYTVLGHDALGHLALAELTQRGVVVHAAWKNAPTRRVLTLVSRDTPDRTIIHFGDALNPAGTDPLPWATLPNYDAAYITAGDALAVEYARLAPVLVASPRTLGLAETSCLVDALVLSASDPLEVYRTSQCKRAPRIAIETQGANGGDYYGEASGTWDAGQLAGPPIDSYGCGDAFIGGLLYAMARGDALDNALMLAAQCGADCLTRRGPYAQPHAIRPTAI